MTIRFERAAAMNHYTAKPLRPFAGHLPQLGERVFIDPSAAVIGDVTLGTDSSVWPQVSIRGDVNSIRIGARTSIQDNCVLHVSHAGPQNPEGHALFIGDDVTVGHAAILHGCRIGNRVLIGMGAIIMDGVVVEDEVVVAAGALVPPGKKLAGGYLYKGNPAQPARALTAQEIDYFRYSAAHYVQLKDRHLAEPQS
jgi:carbonic anhydrase/acetyltransferase-like protein (isoleucine patch superfamily)